MPAAAAASFALALVSQSSAAALFSSVTCLRISAMPAFSAGSAPGSTPSAGISPSAGIGSAGVLPEDRSLGMSSPPPDPARVVRAPPVAPVGPPAPDLSL